MTLEYHSPATKPPCTWGLTVWGILFLCAAALALLNALGRTFSLTTMPAPNSMLGSLGSSISIEPMYSFPQTILILLRYLPAGLGLLICSLGTLRRKRWVRPWILAGCAWLMLEIIAQLPGSLLGQWFSPDGYGDPMQLILETLMNSAGSFGIAFLIFRYFHKPNMVHSLAMYDPRPSRLDRWPLPVLCTAIIATSAAAIWVLEVILNCFGLPASVQRAGLLTNIIGAVNCVIMIIAGLLCLKRPLAGWKLLCLSLTVALIFNLVFHALFPEYYAHLANPDRNPFLTDDPQPSNTPVPGWTVLATSLAYSFTFLAPLLLLRRHFHPASIPPHNQPPSHSENTSAPTSAT